MYNLTPLLVFVLLLVGGCSSGIKSSEPRVLRGGSVPLGPLTLAAPSGSDWTIVETQLGGRPILEYPNPGAGAPRGFVLKPRSDIRISRKISDDPPHSLLFWVKESVIWPMLKDYNPSYVIAGLKKHDPSSDSQHVTLLERKVSEAEVSGAKCVAFKNVSEGQSPRFPGIKFQYLVDGYSCINPRWQSSGWHNTIIEYAVSERMPIGVASRLDDKTKRDFLQSAAFR